MEMISIVIPIYKVEKYLKRCIESVINQEYKNIEILLIDDGSPDKCPQICDEYAKIDKRIRVIHGQNKGLSYARNIGIALAKGEYIMLVDGDDFIDKHMAGFLLNLIKRDKTDLAICSFLYVDEKGNKTNEVLQNYCPLKNDIIHKNKLLNLINPNGFGYWFYTVPVNKLYKSNILKKLKYPESRIYEDEYMAHHLFGSIECASITDKQFYMYTQRENSITKINGYNSLKKMDFVYALEDRYKYFKKEGYTTYAKDTLNILNIVFIKIVNTSFVNISNFVLYSFKMIKIALMQLYEFEISGIKLPIFYLKSFIKLCLKRTEY